MSNEKQGSFSTNLKLVFDHITNYLVCASLFFIGISAKNNPDWLHFGLISEAGVDFHDFAVKIAYFVILIALLLTILNTVMVIRGIFRTFPPISVPGRKRKRGGAARFWLTLIYLVVVYVIVAVSINIQGKA
ncbi:hypothetical protein ACOKV8_004633 [Vibrio parahaemolyticus]